MGMGKCSYQEKCKFFEQDENNANCCEHLYFSTYEDWCGHEDHDTIISNFPLDIINGTDK